MFKYKKIIYLLTRARIQLYITNINYRTCKYSIEKKQYIFKRFRTDSTLGCTLHCTGFITVYANDENRRNS